MVFVLVEIRGFLKYLRIEISDFLAPDALPDHKFRITGVHVLDRFSYATGVSMGI